jgi:hypothetical protein
MSIEIQTLEAQQTILRQLLHTFWGDLVPRAYVNYGSADPVEAGGSALRAIMLKGLYHQAHRSLRQIRREMKAGRVYASEPLAEALSSLVYKWDDFRQSLPPHPRDQHNEGRPR